jgi:hypothetical protein
LRKPRSVQSHKLDRLSWNAAFLLALRDSGVKFLAVDMPKTNDLALGIVALVAKAEREAISKRTKEALSAAKARGVKVRSPIGVEAVTCYALFLADEGRASFTVLPQLLSRRAEDQCPLVVSSQRHPPKRVSLCYRRMHRPRRAPRPLAKQSRIIQLIVERVDIGTDGLDIRLRVNGLSGLVAELRGAGDTPLRQVEAA